MAAPPPSPDTPITLKVAYNGATRRFKLPLRDLTAGSLETKVRHSLITEDMRQQLCASHSSHINISTDTLTSCTRAWKFPPIPTPKLSAIPTLLLHTSHLTQPTLRSTSSCCARPKRSRSSNCVLPLRLNSRWPRTPPPRRPRTPQRNPSRPRSKPNPQRPRTRFQRQTPLVPTSKKPPRSSSRSRPTTDVSPLSKTLVLSATGSCHESTRPWTASRIFRPAWQGVPPVWLLCL